MRISVEIDDNLLKKAMKASGSKNRKEAIEKGLIRLVNQEERPLILDLRGKVEFRPDYDYKELRRDRFNHDE